MNRRTFLRAAGGAALALPLMDSLWARAADTKVYPKRLVLFYNPNGTVRDEWLPKTVTSETEFELGRILSPLSDHKQRLVVFNGVHSLVAKRSDNNGGPHQRGIGALFTGQTLGTGSFVDGCGSHAGWANGISVDQAVANAIGQGTPYKSLELGVRASDNDVQGRISYAGPGQPLPPTNDPAQVYDRLFGMSAREPLDPNDPSDARQSVLDTVKEQFEILQPRLSSDDRAKLEAHLELVRDVERRLNISSGGTTCPLPPPPPELDPSSETDMAMVSRTHLDLLAAAFACDLTRVASVQYSTGFNKIRYPWLDSLKEGHALSHSGPSDTASQEELVKRAAWHAGELAYFLDRLAEIPEGDGSVLDNTLVLWGNEISQGNTHSLDNIPYLIAGSAGGAIKTGRYLEAGGKNNCDLLLSVLHAFDVDVDSFGHPDHCTGPLSGLSQ